MAKIIERRRIIMETLLKDGSVDINDLAAALNVSSMTIRRDLKQLETNGSVEVRQGIATLNDGALQEYNMTFKHQINLAEKQRIASKALEYIGEGESIFIDAGTTTRELAASLSRVRNVNLMTHSLLAANSVSGLRDGSRLIMCPGEFREMSMAFLGPLTDDFIRQFRIDVLFLSTEGVSLQEGVSVVDVLDGHTKKVLIEQASQVICLADSSKFETSYFYNIAPLEDIDLIITDTRLDDACYELYQKSGVNVVRV